MRNPLKQLSIIITLAFVLVSVAGVQAEAETQSSATLESTAAVTYTANISITIYSADGASQSKTEIPKAAPEIWQASVLPEPYDYQYQDQDRYITIKKFSENGMTYFIADVQVSGIDVFKTALSGDQVYGKLEPVSDIAARNQAILAINGDDYGVHKYGTIIRNNMLIRANTTTRNMLIVDQFGNMSVIADRSGEKPKTLSEQLLSGNVWQTFEFGPELIRDGQAVSLNTAFDVISTRSSRREPRTAIGQIDALHYIIIVADGRSDGYSIGMTLPELQQLFIQYGAVTAMNLDGGGSSELWYKGQILNRPAGGRERHVSDIIYF